MKLTPEQVAQELLLRKRAKDSLLAFTEYTHPRWDTSWHHELICEYLEKVERGEIDRLCINAPPRHSKSELFARRFSAWFLGRNPYAQLITSSAAGDLAGDIGADVRDILKEREYQNVFPGVALRQDAKAATRWRTEQGGIFIAAGVGGQIVGRGADLAIIDDPHRGREDADSPRMRDVVAKWYYGDLLNRLMRRGRIVLGVTRWHEDDLAGRVLLHPSEWEQLDEKGYVYRSGDWVVLKLKAIQHEGTDHEEALWPGPDDPNAEVGFPLEVLKRRKADMIKGGRLREWTSQFQQEPKVEEGTYIKRAWFEERYKKAPDDLRIYMASDFAVTDRKDARDPDWTEHGVFGIGPDQKVYPLDWWSGQVEADEWIERLLDLVVKWRPMCWFGEKGQIRKSVEPFLKRRMRERKVFFRVEWIARTKDKTSEGRSFQALASAGRVVAPEMQPWWEAVMEQCVGFPSATHDDKFDVMALMCAQIDNMHEAIILPEPVEKPRDRWQRLNTKVPAGWRVV